MYTQAAEWLYRPLHNVNYMEDDKLIGLILEVLI